MENKGFEIELEETSSRDSDEIQDGGHAAKMAETSTTEIPPKMSDLPSNSSDLPSKSSDLPPKPEGSPRPKSLSMPGPSELAKGDPTSSPTTPNSIEIAQRSAAVTVRGGYLSYVKNVPVLNNFNMTVQEGSIYGLLGASGCGKTTVLSCVVGRRKLDVGEIRVLGHAPGSPESGIPGSTVGYMPQEIAVYDGFTITETLHVFGYFHGLSSKQIVKRTEELLKSFDLPPASRFIGSLSGGQKRRISLCIALLHRPTIVILDEPTVGVDPVLRQSIWKLLLDMTRDERTTVIITTHYIEEALQAHTIGLMRQGVLLAEDRPMRLLRRFSCASMEEVFLKLSLRQERKAHGMANGRVSLGGALQHLENMDVDEAPEEIHGAAVGGIAVDDSGPKSPLVSKPRLRAKGHMGNVQAFLWKNIIYIRRNVLAIVFIFSLPAVICGIFGVTVGRDPQHLRISVVNEDADCLSEHLDSSNTSLAIPGFPGFPSNCTTSTIKSLSCLLLSRIPKDLVSYNPRSNLQEGLDDVRSGYSWGLLHFPANYTRYMAGRVIYGRFASDKALNYSEFDVFMDMSNQFIAQTLRAKFLLGTIDFMNQLQEGCKWNTRFTVVPIQIKEPIYGRLTPSFQDFTTPGLILTTVFFMAVLVTVGGILAEKADGMLERSLIAGVRMYEVIIGHFVTDLVLMVGQMIVVLFSLLVVFKLTNEGSIILVVLLAFIQGLCGICFGFLISVMCDSEITASYFGLGSFFPFIFLSGMMWPAEGMHIILRSIGWALPLTQATTAMRCILARGWGISSPDVYGGFLSSSAWLLIFIFLTWVAVKRHVLN